MTHQTLQDAIEAAGKRTYPIDHVKKYAIAKPYPMCVVIIKVVDILRIQDYSVTLFEYMVTVQEEYF